MESKCRSCGHTAKLSNHYSDEHILQCSLCKAFQFVGPLGDLAQLYTEDYYNGAEYINYNLGAPVYRRNFVRKLNLLHQHCSELAFEDMRVLEVGCANGDFMQVLKEHGVVGMLGVEASEYSRNHSQQRGFDTLDPFAPDYLARVKDFAPNVICAWDVWEHMENPSDIFDVLLSQNPTIHFLALSTVDSGALVPRLKGKKWRQFHPPTHLNYPTRRSFELYFERIGFKLMANQAFGYYRPLADYLSLFLKTETLNSYPWLFKVPLYLNLFDIQLVVAKRIL
jgi:hypothetical protein